MAENDGGGNFLDAKVYNKRVLILGFGKEGKSTLGFLNKTRAYAVCDVADAAREKPCELNSGGHKYICGPDYLSASDDYDIIIKSPGVPVPREAWPKRAELTSQTELFLRRFGANCIGITGTKGKSTVSKLIFHTLARKGADVLLAGNIGVPVFDIADGVKEKTIVVLELSCHQLEFCRYSPSRAVLLNIFADHLDRYKTFEAYAETKANIYKNQSPNDALYCLKSLSDSVSARSKKIAVDAQNAPFSDFSALEGAKLRGRHNILNCAFAYEVCKDFGVTGNDFAEAVQTFEPLPHRLEYIGELNGAAFFDDSISTTAESAISALESVDGGKIILIGGLDRGLDYAPLIRFLTDCPSVAHAIFMYASGERIFKNISAQDAARFHYAADLRRAVRLAKKLLKPGFACVLSPAAASYGHFKDFAERGEKFREYVFGKSEPKE